MFITFEGPDGSGKTTQSKLLYDYLQSAGYAVIWTREPGGSVLGQTLRKLLLEDTSIQLSKEAELLLFAADRAQHLQDIILPALAANKIVICDRFIDSTYAYQYGGRQLPKSDIEFINTYATQGVSPDLTFLVDIPVEIGLSRAGQDKFEVQGTAFFERVRAAYLEQANKHERCIIVNGNSTIEVVFEQIKSLLLKNNQFKALKS